MTTYQRCLATHTGTPPEALGELRLCESDYDRLTDALTGPSAAEDPTIEATWGYRGVASDTVTVAGSRTEAEHIVERSHLRRIGRHPNPGPWLVLLCGDGTGWWSPTEYQPAGLARDWAALQLREKTLRTGDPAPYVANGAAEAPLPIDTTVADIRLRITHALDYWVQQHVERNRLTRPTLATIYQTTKWLAVHKDWAARQNFAGEYADSLRELRSRVRHVIDLPQPRRFEIAPCPAYVDGHRCTGTLVTTARDPRDPTPVVIHCDTCPGAYDSTQWTRLRKRLDQRPV